MRYFVIAPDGSRYGPADLNTLRAWVAQGRISPDTILEEEASRQRVAARMVAGLFPVEGTMLPPPTAHQRRFETGRGAANDGTADVIFSYICSAMSILCCGFFIIGAFAYANRAISKGNRSGYTARIVAIVFLVLYCVSSVLMMMFFGQIKELLIQRTGIDFPGAQ